MSYRIREFRDSDYPAMIAVSNAVFPDYPSTEEEGRHGDAHRDPKCRFERFVAESETEAGGTEVVGVGIISQSATSYHPRKFALEVLVHPDWQGRSIGKGLYEHLLDRLAEANPISVSGWGREGMDRTLRFLADRGFTETMREWESRLDVRAFDPDRFAGAQERVAERGIQIKSLAELLESDPDCWRKVYDVIWDVEEDVPRSDVEFSPPEFERWVERHRSKPTLLPEGYFLAVDGDRYVGVSWVNTMLAAPDLDTGLTGVRRDYRRYGIALALKLRVIDFARERGYPVIRTWNASTNQGMLSINNELGFVRQPAWIDFVKKLAVE